MGIKIGTGTFILRHELPGGLEKPMEKLAAIGFEGLELVGLFGHAARDVRMALDRNDLQAIGDHVPVREFLAHAETVLADRKALGCAYLTLACSPEEIAAGADSLIAAFERGAMAVRDAGLVPLYHNHDFDMRGERPFAARVLDAVPALSFEPDVGWMVYAGQDPDVYLKKYRDRCPVIHLKDLYADDLTALKPGAAAAEIEYDPENGGFAFCPTGYGVVNTPRLIGACLACQPEWLVVDHDLAYERNLYDDLKMSYDYVKALLMLHQ